jgi:hypothetical protein
MFCMYCNTALYVYKIFECDVTINKYTVEEHFRRQVFSTQKKNRVIESDTNNERQVGKVQEQ